MSGATQPPRPMGRADEVSVALFLHALRLATGVRRGFVLDTLDWIDYEPATKA